MSHAASKVGFFFYKGDWLKDTRILTLEVKGAWVDLLCILQENRGTVTWPLEGFARFWSTSVETATQIIVQLDQFKTAEVEWFITENGLPKKLAKPDFSENFSVSAGNGYKILLKQNLVLLKSDECSENNNLDDKTVLKTTENSPSENFAVKQTLSKMSAKVSNRKMARGAEKEEHIHAVRSFAGKIGQAKRQQNKHPSSSSSLNINIKKNTSKKKYSLSEHSVELAKLLAELIRKNNPNVTEAKNTQLDAWAKEADRMERIDHHPFTEIRLVLEWSQQDSFWRRNILSMSKLREKWNVLSGRMLDQADREGGRQTYADRVRERTMQILKGGKT